MHALLSVAFWMVQIFKNCPSGWRIKAEHLATLHGSLLEMVSPLSEKIKDGRLRDEAAIEKMTLYLDIHSYVHQVLCALCEGTVHIHCALLAGLPPSFLCEKPVFLSSSASI